MMPRLALALFALAVMAACRRPTATSDISIDDLPRVAAQLVLDGQTARAVSRDPYCFTESRRDAANACSGSSVRAWSSSEWNTLRAAIAPWRPRRSVACAQVSRPVLSGDTASVWVFWWGVLAVDDMYGFEVRQVSFKKLESGRYRVRDVVLLEQGDIVFPDDRYSC